KLENLQADLLERDRKLKVTRDEAFAAAEKLFASQDYGSCLKQISRIDGSLVDADIRLLKEKAESSRDRLKVLRGTITARVNSNQLHGLLSSVEEALELQSAAEDLQKLRQQLIERDQKLRATRDEAFAAAEKLFASQDYGNCLKQISRIDDSLVDADIRLLKEKAESSRDRLKDLRDTINARVKSNQLHGLLSSVEEALELQSAAEDLQKLRQQLIERNKNAGAAVATVIERAQKQKKECHFDAAVSALQKISDEFTTQESNELLDNCQHLNNLRCTAMRALEMAMASCKYSRGVRRVKAYRQALADNSLGDLEFEQAYETCECKRQTAWRKTVYRLMIAVSVTAAIFALVVVYKGISLRSSMRASAVASAIQEQRWDDALALDQDNVPALIGRANQRLEAATPDIEGAFADIGLAEQVDPTVAEIKPAKALAYAKRATAQATDGKISESARDLKEAETLGASDRQLTTVRQLLAAAYLKRATAQATDGKISESEKDLKEAESLGASGRQLTPVRQLLAAAYMKQAEDGVARGDVAGIRAACDAAERFQAADSDVSRLRAAAFKADGEQKEKSGDLAGAVAAFEEAVKLNSSLGLKTERAVLHVKLAEQAVAKQDYAAAATELYSALSLGASASESASLKDKLVTALTARCRQSLGSQDVAKASADYGSLRKLDPQAASGLVSEFEKLPASVLSQLPVNVLTQLPPRKNSIGMQFKLLPGGTFTMGEGGEAHKAMLTKPFELGVYEVTQEQYEQVMGSTPSKFKGPQNPVEKVSWNDAVEFCRKLSDLPSEKSGGYVYRLPTEAEWEYACRAGTTTKYSFGDSESELGDYAWYDKNSGRRPHPVGGKKPNGWGLYDMHGNVWEWCQDWYGKYPSGSVTNPTGPASGSSRVNRGGGWYDYSDICRSAKRHWYAPDSRSNNLGFRVLRSSIK
ncbi:MAG: SUMF1/EgtB/PvdO family nonheme iron enzyme, partial [Fuerstiella sp.]